MRLPVFLLAAALSISSLSAQNQPDKLDLDGALRYAIENNHSIRQARERIKQQEGVQIEVSAARLPKLALSASSSVNDKAVSTTFPADDHYWNISLSASQTIYAGGGVTASVKNSRLLREAAVLELQSVINEQLLLVRTLYFSVLLNKERISVQEENVKLLEEQLKMARNRYEAGASSNFDVLRAEVALANGRPPLIQARNDYRISIQELRQVLGIPSSRDAMSSLEVLGSLSLGPREELQLSDALSTARTNRPELLRLAKLTDAGVQGVKAAKAGYQPTVSLFGRYDVVKGGSDAGWGNRTDGATAGIQGQWNLFDGRSTAGKVVQARSQLNQTRLSLEELELAIDVEVRRAISNMQEAWEMVESTGKVVSQAEEALRLANVRYGAGTATQLDVLTSQVALTEARLNQLSACHGYNVALASQRKAVGTADGFSSK